MHIGKATSEYERWLARHTKVDSSDLTTKHELMAGSPFALLRASFYRWMQLFPETCPGVADAPKILAIGDLHVENFGTWRDSEGRLVWGVNDFDEAAVLPWTIDLARLATSAILASESDHFDLAPDVICESILDGYRRGIETRGSPFVLAEQNVWLRDIASAQLRDPGKFFEKLSRLPASGGVPAPARDAMKAMLPERGLAARTVRRRAGVGSRGHQRFVALAEWRGGLIAREAKALAPSAACFVDPRLSTRLRYAEIVSGAVRCADPCSRLVRGWIVRRLAPDCSKINLAELSHKISEHVLVAMGFETANIHHGTRGAPAAIAKDLKKRKKNWLVDATHDLARETRKDWKDWKG